MHRRRVISCCLETILVATACTRATDRDGAPSAAGVVQPSPSESVDDDCSMPDELRPPPPTNALRGRIAYRLPAWSPDGSTIVFQSNRCAKGERTDLYAMDADGSNLRRLTKGFAEQPTWSPDGRWLAFNSCDGLAVMNARGGEARSLGLGTGTLPDWIDP
ncbi:MAG: hypothetical protein WBM72_02065 [Actinomycetota bacterium]